MKRIRFFYLQLIFLITKINIFNYLINFFNFTVDIINFEFNIVNVNNALLKEVLKYEEKVIR